MKRIAVALMAALAVISLTACEGGGSSGGGSYPNGVWFLPVVGPSGSPTLYPIFY